MTSILLSYDLLGGRGFSFGWSILIAERPIGRDLESGLEKSNDVLH